MDAFTKFEYQVEEALSRLYDPAYRPQELLCLQLGFPTSQPDDLVRQKLAQAIEQLQPAIDVPASARVRRIYDLLNLRYLQEKTQKETALHLGITVRHLRREQQLAIHLLAERLWEQAEAQPIERGQAGAHSTISGSLAEEANKQGEKAEVDWRQQLHSEIQALQSNAPGIVANVQETFATITELADALTAGAEVILDVKPVAPDLWVPTHPSVLREVLITAVGKLVPSLQPASVVQFSVETLGEQVRIVLSAAPTALRQLPDSNFIAEVLEIYHGSFAVHHHQQQTELSFTLPLITPLRVLVVDDNDDLVHFYRRYTEGTRYVVEHVAHAQQLWDTLDQEAPDGASMSTAIRSFPQGVAPHVIVLDIMLPGIGGWDVLRQLRKHRLTQNIPIIICSVIQHEELARTLGATLYLTKPVRRHEFLRALDSATQALTLAPLRQQ